MSTHRDEEFIRGDVPITKRDIRALSMDYLDVQTGDKCLDVGAGTGSISVEMACAGGCVTAVEINDEACELIEKNSEHFGVEINLIRGKAPEALPNLAFDRIFIGGSKGKLKEIIDYAHEHLTNDGVIVMNFILLKNAAFATQYMKDLFSDVETVLIQTSNMDKLGMLRANNPIFIIKGVKR